MKDLVIVRGGGDLATGTIYKLYKCGFKVLVLEIPNPSAIRREVAFCEAVYQGSKTVEDVTCYLASDVAEATEMLNEGKMTMLIDPDCSCLEKLQPIAVVDGILAKKNLGMHMDMAPVTVAMGPGFEAGVDVDAVIETMRGHNLGKVIYEGSAEPNTGIPGNVGGYTSERVLRAPADGILRNINTIADTVKKGETIAYVESGEDKVPVTATLDGLLRGLIRDGYPVKKGLKIADIDPRLNEYDNCFTISDKARCIAGGVLEAVMHLTRMEHSND